MNDDDKTTRAKLLAAQGKPASFIAARLKLPEFYAKEIVEGYAKHRERLREWNDKWPA